MGSRKCRKEPVQGVSQAEVQPWHRLGGMEHVCELRKSSQVLYAIFVTILRTIYAGKKGRTFGCPDVVWKTDPQKTSIWIDTELRWEDQRPDFTPAIFVNLGEIKYEYVPTLDMVGRMNMNPNGERHYERTGAGTVQIIHVSDKAGAACALADNTENYLSSLQDQITYQYCFDSVSVIGRVPRQQKETAQTAGKGKYVSVVAMKFEFSDAWDIKFETPILKRADLNFEGFENKDGIAVGKAVRICGTDIDTKSGTIEIEFGDMATETDLPLEPQ